MKKAVFFVIISILLIFSVCSSTIVRANNKEEQRTFLKPSIEEDFSNDKVIVVLSNEESVKLLDYEKNSFDVSGIEKIENLTSGTLKLHRKMKNGDTSFIKKENDIRKKIDMNSYHQILMFTLQEKTKENVLRIISLLNEDERVIMASPDYAFEAASVPNDYTSSGDYDNWWYSNISMLEAWNESNSSTNVIIGVVDKGIDGTHIDLTNNMYKIQDSSFNYTIPNLNHNFSIGQWIDEGEIDDPELHVIGNDNNFSYYDNHGTHVAGIIGAEGNNEFGIVGTCWHTKMVSLRVFDGLGRTSNEYIINAVDYATLYGIDILNMSLGVSTDNGLRFAIGNYPGLVICSAGNENLNIDRTPQYPASLSLKNLITVGASDEYDNKTFESNYGNTYVDLYAPGEDIYSTVPNNGYLAMSGTSMAAPFVTGVAALILGNNPNYSSAEIKERIMNNVDKLDSLAGKCASNGRLNAYRALTCGIEPKTFIGDVDGDGFDDMIFVRNTSNGYINLYGLFVLKGSSNSMFSSTPISTITSIPFSYFEDVFIGDFNGDNRKDILIQSNSGSYRSLWIYTGKADGTFNSSNLISTTIHDPIGIPCKGIVADKNNDGYDDYLVIYKYNSYKIGIICYFGSEVSPYLDDASNTYSSSSVNYDDTDLLFKGDYNGDGRDDILIHSTHYTNQTIKRKFYIFASTSTGFELKILATNKVYSPSENYGVHLVGDVDNNGKNDFIACYKENGCKYALAFWGTPLNSYLIDPLSIALSSTDPFNVAYPILIGDVNGDGRSDLISIGITNNNSVVLKCFRGKNDGCFDTINYYFSYYYQSPSIISNFYVMDVNGDGYDDFVIKKNNLSDISLYVFNGSSAGFSGYSSISTIIPYYD